MGGFDAPATDAGDYTFDASSTATPPPGGGAPETLGREGLDAG